MDNELNDAWAIFVDQNGCITLPAQLQKIWSIEVDDVVTAILAGEIVVLTPKTLRIPELADQMTVVMETANVTLDELLEDLPMIRQAFYDAKYRC